MTPAVYIVAGIAAVLVGFIVYIALSAMMGAGGHR